MFQTTIGEELDAQVNQCMVESVILANNPLSSARMLVLITFSSIPMTDVLTPAQRSHCMSKIRGGDTKIEVVLRKSLWRRGLRYRIKTTLPGKPDIVFHKQKVSVFVDGCFWHKCDEHYSTPKTNTEFWEEKIAKNVTRDSNVNSALIEDGWIVIRLWEHSIKNDLAACVQRIVTAVGQN